jgi:hypothetical protein
VLESKSIRETHKVSRAELNCSKFSGIIVRLLPASELETEIVEESDGRVELQSAHRYTSAVKLSKAVDGKGHSSKDDLEVGPTTKNETWTDIRPVVPPRCLTSQWRLWSMGRSRTAAR